MFTRGQRVIDFFLSPSAGSATLRLGGTGGLKKRNKELHYFFRGVFAIYGQRAARFRFSGQATALSVDVSQTIVRGLTSRLNSLTDLPTSSPSDLPSYLPAGLLPSWHTDIRDLPSYRPTHALS